MVLVSVVCMVFFTSMITANKTIENNPPDTKSAVINNAPGYAIEENNWVDSLYNSMDIEELGLSRSVFYTACKGYEYLLSQNKLSKPGLLTICDYSQASNKKRLYILDLENEKVLFNTYVAHGRNSGSLYATQFSNKNSSHKTSLGFMVTAETYFGDNGYSLRLDGMEKGFNNNVRARTIVLHGSNYVNAQRASENLLGRSYGCPAVPAGKAEDIIDCIKGGSCFFSYYPDKYYTNASRIINADFIWPDTQTRQLASVKIPDSLTGISLAHKYSN